MVWLTYSEWLTFTSMCTVMPPEPPPFTYSPSYYPPPRARSGSRLPGGPPEQLGVRKSGSGRSRSSSTSHAGQSANLLPEQIRNDPSLGDVKRFGDSWQASRRSPQPHLFFEPVHRAAGSWSTPLAPQADAGLPAVSAQAAARVHGTTTSSIDSGVGLVNYPPTTSSAALR